MRLPTPQASRPGLTLLEVLVATAIFVVAVSGISSLVSMASDHALEVQIRNQTSRICQSTLARVQSGELPLSSQGGTPVDEDPDYQWSVECDQSNVGNAGTVNNLWTVTIKVSHEMPGHGTIESSLTQLVIDPTVIGSTQDYTPIAGSTTSSASGTSGTTGSTSASAGGTMGGGATPAKNTGAANATKPAAPAASGAAASTPKTMTPSNTPKTTTPSGGSGGGATPSTSTPKTSTPATGGKSGGM